MPASPWLPLTRRRCALPGLHFSGADLMRLGQSLCEAIGELADADEDQLLDEMAASIDFGKK